MNEDEKSKHLLRKEFRALIDQKYVHLFYFSQDFINSQSCNGKITLSIFTTISTTDETEQYDRIVH
jgi:hypothetical protein